MPLPLLRDPHDFPPDTRVWLRRRKDAKGYSTVPLGLDGEPGVVLAVFRSMAHVKTARVKNAHVGQNVWYVRLAELDPRD